VQRRRHSRTAIDAPEDEVRLSALGSKAAFILTVHHVAEVPIPEVGMIVIRQTRLAQGVGPSRKVLRPVE
jgi:hypothetical protein